MYTIQVSNLFPFQFHKLIHFWDPQKLLKKLNVNSFNPNPNPSVRINPV